ncbi:hypothetical protein PN477_00330 [Spirulina subsalsa CS-330]|nr:hypothetical protein [Spirulina subsalsa CS-330]
MTCAVCAIAVLDIICAMMEGRRVQSLPANNPSCRTPELLQIRPSD